MIVTVRRFTLNTEPELKAFMQGVEYGDPGLEFKAHGYDREIGKWFVEIEDKEATSSRWEPIDMRFACRQNHKDISRCSAEKLLQEIHRRDHLGMDWDEVFERASMMAQQGEITLTDLPEDFDPAPESIEALEEMPWE